MSDDIDPVPIVFDEMEIHPRLLEGEIDTSEAIDADGGFIIPAGEGVDHVLASLVWPVDHIIVLRSRSRWRRILGAPRVFLRHYRVCLQWKRPIGGIWTAAKLAFSTTKKCHELPKGD